MAPTQESESQQVMLSQPQQIQIGTGHIHIDVATGTRPYTLNRHKALDNKLQSCHMEHLQYAMKGGKNLVLKLSTSAFEYFRMKLPQLFHESAKDLGLYIESRENADLSDAVVDSWYKVRNRKKDGTPGAQSRFTVNLYRTQSSVLVNGPKVDIFIEHFLKPIEALIQENSKSLSEKNLQIKGALSIAGYSTNKKTEIASEQTPLALTKPTDSDMNTSTNSEETLFKCSHCFDEVEEGIQCDDCQQWNHCSCECVSNELFQLYNQEEVSYSCLSCRQLEKDDTYIDSVNSILIDEMSMRDPEGDDNVSLSLSGPATPMANMNVNPNIEIARMDKSEIATRQDNPVTRTHLTADATPISSINSSPGEPTAPTKIGNSTSLSSCVAACDNSPNTDRINNIDKYDRSVGGGSNIALSITRPVASSTSEMSNTQSISNDHETSRATKNLTVPTPSTGGTEENSTLNPQCNKKKKAIPNNKKGIRKDDSHEQLAHAKSVIYSLEKKVEDMNVSNRLLAEELSLLRRQYPQHQQFSSSNPHMVQEATSRGPVERETPHSGQNSRQPPLTHQMHHVNPHSGGIYVEAPTEPGFYDYRYALQTTEAEMKMLKDRQHALEMEHLRFRLTQVEQVNQHLNYTTNLLISNQMYRLHPNYLASTMYNNTPIHPLGPFQATAFGNPMQTCVYPTILTQPTLRQMGHLVPGIPTMTTLHGMNSQMRRGTVHPANSFNVQQTVQQAPPPASMMGTNERRHLGTDQSHMFAANTQQRPVAQNRIPDTPPASITDKITNTVSVIDRTHVMVDDTSSECVYESQRIEDDASPLRPERKVIDLTSTESQLEENVRPQTPLRSDDCPRNASVPPQRNGNHHQNQNTIKSTDKSEQIPSSTTPTSQSFLGAGRATEATARMEELQLQLSMSRM